MLLDGLEATRRLVADDLERLSYDRWGFDAYHRFERFFCTPFPGTHFLLHARVLIGRDQIEVICPHRHGLHGDLPSLLERNELVKIAQPEITGKLGSGEQEGPRKAMGLGFQLWIQRA